MNTYDNIQLRKDVAKIIHFNVDTARTYNDRMTYTLDNIKLVSYVDNITIIYHGKTAISHNSITTDSYIGKIILNEIIKIEEMET